MRRIMQYTVDLKTISKTENSSFCPSYYSTYITIHRAYTVPMYVNIVRKFFFFFFCAMTFRVTTRRARRRRRYYNTM